MIYYDNVLFFHAMTAICRKTIKRLPDARMQDSRTYCRALTSLVLGDTSAATPSV